MSHQRKWLFLLILSSLLLLFTACTPTPNCAPVYNVSKTADTNDGVCSVGDCSLREAVDNANACSGAQTIYLPAGGYVLTIDGDDEDDNETGDLDITDDLTIAGAGAPSINGNIERAFHIHSGVTATLEGILLEDGDAIYGGGLINEGLLTLYNFTCNYNKVSIPPGGMGDAMGGCIFNAGESHIYIYGGHFLSNTAEFGGAIYNNGTGTVDITDSLLIGNFASNHGGAIWNDLNGRMHITDSTLEQNQAGANGGAVWSHGSVTVEGSVIKNNQAIGNGGGVYIWEGFGTLENSWLTLNTAYLGGGAHNEDGMLHFYQSGLTANTATGGMGGGIYNIGLSPSNGLLMSNTTVSGNTAVGGGGGIYNNGQFDLRFISIADNNPEGLHIDGGLEIKLRSSILANNTGGNCAGTAPDSLHYNISSDASCGFTDPTDLSSSDPLLEPLGNYGSVAPSHPLGVGSPAIDSGVPDLCTANDQNYTPRPQGSLCDRGAFEYSASTLSADMNIVDLSLSSKELWVNGHVEVEVTVANQGAAVASGYELVLIPYYGWGPPNPAGYVPLPDLAPGASHTEIFTPGVLYPDPGTFTLRILVTDDWYALGDPDSTGTAGDFIEQTITVSENEEAEVMKDMNIIDLSLSSTNIIVNGRVEVEVTVANQGSAIASGYELVLIPQYGDGPPNPAGYVPLPDLAPGESHTEIFSPGVFYIDPGTFTLRVLLTDDWYTTGDPDSTGTAGDFIDETITVTDNQCISFDIEVSKLVQLGLPPETRNLPLYLKFEGDVPGLDEEPYNEYNAKLGEIEAYKCGLQGFPDRLYCMFYIPEGMEGTTQTLEVTLNDCIDPFFIQQYVSIPEPIPTPEPISACSSDLNKTDCEEAGGSFITTGSNTYCVCP